MKRKIISTLIAILAIFSMVLSLAPVLAVDWAPETSPPGQTPVPASTIEQFAQPLAKLDVAGGTIQTIVAGSSQINLEMREFQTNMLPSSFTPASGTYNGTWVWGYVNEGTNTSVTRDTYTGPVVVATRGTPSTFKFTNNLPTTATTNALAYLNSTDQSLHWANPNGVDRYVNIGTVSTPIWVGTADHYTGGIPAAVHLHGAEDPAAVDGGPDSWFLSDGSKVGPAFYSEGWDGMTPQNYCIYTYPNTQEAAPTWFHDHTLGATRLNVYMGLAGGYDLIDPGLTLPAGLNAVGLRGGALGSNPADDAPIPLVIQDRMFDQNGQLYFPSGANDPVDPALNPEHPYWNPEFMSETPNISATICVNGKVWPYLEVKAQRYEFYTIDGSNARSYILSFQNTTPLAPGYTAAFDNTYGGTVTPPTIYQIATDQGYLDTPVAVDPLVIMPGERAVFIVDFGGATPGTNFVLNNFGPDAPLSDLPVPAADFNDPATTGTVMQFRVVDGAAPTDTSYDPASGTPIRTGGQQIVRLVDPITGTLASGVIVDLTRELTLNEIANDNPTTVNGITFGGGPLEILVNNTKWTGRQSDPVDPNNMATPADQSTWTFDGLMGGMMNPGNYLSEVPVEGTTEVWEIVNTTMDAHPIHTHLAQFQLLNREAYDVGTYSDPLLGTTGTGFLRTYELAFGGSFIPSDGPPLSYNAGSNPQSGGKYGGNPDVTPFLMAGTVTPPNPNEAGWKDTVMCPPGMVTRFVVRWGPTDAPVGTANLQYPFVPNGPLQNMTGVNGMYDYVWHCHIVDHEDNEMMRPDAVYIAPTVNAGVDEALSSGGTLSGHAGSFRASGAPPWTATVNFGDGTGTQPLVFDMNSFTLPATLDKLLFKLPNHQYPAASATYTVTVAITDGTGAIGTDTFKVTVTSIDFNPKTLNLKSKGVFKVTIYGGATFDVGAIDKNSLKFGPNPFNNPNNIPSKVQIYDVNGDGILDMLAFFDRPDSLTVNSTSASIWGKIGGVDFIGTTSIHVLSK